MPEYVTIEKGQGPDGRIAVVRFDRGDGINAMSPEAMRQLTSAARSFEDDASTSVVVLTGSAKSFTAGFDLRDPEGRSRKTMDLGALRQHLKLGPRMTRAWQEMEQITIGAIEGFCIGGGVALAVALDFRVMGIGLFAPPFGVGYYAACAIGRVDPNEGIGPIWGYLLALMVGLIIVAIFPWISIGFL